MSRDQTTKLRGDLAAQYSGSTSSTPGRATQSETNDAAQDASASSADAAHAEQQQPAGEAQGAAQSAQPASALYSQSGPFASFANAAQGPTPETTPAAAAAAPAAKSADSKAESRGAKDKEGGEGSSGTPATKAAPATGKSTNTSGLKISTEHGGAARTVVGVGEKVTFTDTEEGDWKATDSLMGATNEMSGTSFTWQAPASAKNVTVTHSGKGKPKTVTMTVVAPTGIDFKKVANVPVASAGAGMKLNLIMQPTTVSFYNVDWLEVPGPAENKSGYFLDYATQTGASLHHDPYSKWLPMGGANNEVFDYARTEDKPKIAVGGKPAAWYEGGYDWHVPNKFRVKGDAGEGAVFTTVTQSARMEGGANAGRVTITKGGASASQKADGTTEGDIETFKTVEEAKAKLIPLGGNRLRVSHALAWIANARAKGVDQLSIDNMIAAIKSANAQMYVSVQCTNTYKWFDADPVSVQIGKFTKSANSFGKPLTINTGKQADFRVALNDFVDWASGSTAMAAVINVTADGNALRTSVAFPFDSQGQAMDGSNGRYLVTTGLRDDVEKI